MELSTPGDSLISHLEVLGGRRAMHSGKGHQATGLAFVLILAGLTALVTVSHEVVALTPRSPILIDGDGSFTAANGVVAGSGGPLDPYVIEGWDINASEAVSNTSSLSGIRIQNTNAHFLIRDLRVHSGGFGHPGIDLWQVSNGRIENVTLVGNGGGFTARYVTNVTLSDSSVIDNWEGVYAYQSDNLTLRQNNISSNDYNGVRLSDSGTVVVEGNLISANWAWGLSLERLSGVVVRNNVVSGNRGLGIFLWYTTGGVFEGNVLSDDGLVLRGNLVDHFNDHSFAPNNTINGNLIRYYRDCSGLVVDGIPIGHLIVANCTNVQVSNLTASGTDGLITFAFVDGVSLTSSDINATSWETVFITDSANVTIAGNDLGDSPGRAISLSSTSNARIETNVFRNHSTGIWWDTGIYTDLTISGNAFVDSGFAIYLSRGGTGLDIHQNNFTRGVGGIYLSSGRAIHVHDNLFTDLNESAIWANSLDAVFARNDIFGGLFGITIRGFTNNTVRNNTVQATSDGIHVFVANDVLIDGNTVSGAGAGIRTTYADNVTVINNTLAGNGVGIFLGNSTDVRVNHNTLDGNAIQA